MKRYIKDGKIKTAKDIVLRKGGKQIINPKEDMLIEEGWSEYTPPAPTEPTEEEIERRHKESEVRHAKELLAESDYKVIKCIEAFLCGEEMPYDIHELHRERNEHRERVRRNER